MENKSNYICSKFEIPLNIQNRWFSTLCPCKILVSSDFGFQDKRKELTFEWFNCKASEWFNCKINPGNEVFYHLWSITPSMKFHHQWSKPVKVYFTWGMARFANADTNNVSPFFMWETTVVLPYWQRGETQEALEDKKNEILPLRGWGRSSCHCTQTKAEDLQGTSVVSNWTKLIVN